MAEQSESKAAGKLDMISSLQMKNSQNVEKKKEEEINDDDWIEYSDEEENEINNQPKTKEVGKFVAKDQNKAKKFANLKDYLGDDSAKKSHGPHTSKYKKKQGGTFYSEKNDQNNRVDKDGLSKPVFTSSIKRDNVQNIVSDEAYGSIRNTNTEYTKKSNYNTYNTERKQFFNSKPVERSDNFNNFNIANPVKKPIDEKENVLKSISTFGSLVKNLNEENKNIKAPLKSYLDIDLNKERYYDKPKEPGHSGQHQHSERSHHVDRPHHSERSHHVDRHHHDRHERHQHKERENDDGLQRPTFTNTALEKKPTNFRELDTQGDLYLKKMQIAEQEKEKENLGKENKEPRETYKKRGTGNYLKERERDINYNTNNQSDEDNIGEESENKYKFQSGYKKKRQTSYIGYHHDDDDDVWNMVKVAAEDSEFKNTQATAEKAVTTKPKKIIRKEKPEERRMSENNLEPGKDKVVISVGPAKSIKDIFG